MISIFKQVAMTRFNLFTGQSLEIKIQGFCEVSCSSESLQENVIPNISDTAINNVTTGIWNPTLPKPSENDIAKAILAIETIIEITKKLI
jgi:hypothetical protein